MKSLDNCKIPRLFEIMKERKITAAELARKTGTSQASLSDWKMGRATPTSGTLCAIADYLNTTPEYLRGESDEKNKPTGVNADELDKDVNELVKLTKDFSDDEFKAVLDYAEFLISKRKQ